MTERFTKSLNYCEQITLKCIHMQWWFKDKTGLVKIYFKRC